MNETARPVGNQHSGRLLPVGASTVLLLLIALAVGGLDWGSVALILVVVAAGVALFTWIYRGGGFLALALANFLALYTCLFDLVVEFRFATVSEPIANLGYALPIVAFLTGACWFRHKVRTHAERTEQNPLRSSINRLMGLLLIAFFAAGVVATSDMSLTSGQANALLAGFSGAIGLVAFVSSQQVTLFLLRAARLFETFFGRVASQTQAMFAFLTFYSLIVIVFACLYRIIDLYSPGHHFLVAGALRDVTFVESLYFSVITLSTVGYGDITPITNSVRALVAVQTVAGVLLMLFGFAEIMRHATGSRKEGS